MLAQCPRKGSSLPAGGHRCQVVAYVCSRGFCPEHQRALIVPTPIPCHVHQPHIPPESVEVPWSWRDWSQRKQALENRHCQMNSPCHIESVVEPRPPKARPNGLLEGKSGAQIIPTQRALQGVWALDSAMETSTMSSLCQSLTMRTSSSEGKTLTSVCVRPW